jgi:type IV secretory pathway VirB2 component (pilin)
MYSFNHHSFQFGRRPMLLKGLLLLAMFMVLLPLEVWAADPLPFEGPLDALKAAVTGPIAGGLSLMGIVAAGAMLIFGGDFSGFMRSLVFLVLVISIIVGAAKLITGLGLDDIASLDTGSTLAMAYAGKFV